MRQFNQNKMIKFVGAGLTIGLFFACAFGPSSRAEKAEKAKSNAANATGTGLSAEDEAAFLKRFQSDVWPLLSRNCATCHTGANASQLRLSKESEANFKLMLTDGHFEAENPAGLLARVTTPDTTPRMPPAPLPAWTEAEIAILRDFTNDLYAKRKHGRPRAGRNVPGDADCAVQRQIRAARNRQYVPHLRAAARQNQDGFQ